MENEVFLSDGFITPHEVYIQISDADLAILPSRIGSATSLMLPVKLLEYAWLGIPCISSRTKTISHYFDEEMIMFTDSDTPEAFASKIMMVIKNESLRQHYSSSIRKFYNKFSFFEERERYTNIITSMLSLTNRLHDNSKPVSNTYKHIV